MLLQNKEATAIHTKSEETREIGPRKKLLCFLLGADFCA